MAASLVGAGQLKLTLLPPTRASNSVTARRPPRARIDGRATRPLAGTLHPATCPPIWAGRAGCPTDPVPVKPPLRALSARWHLPRLA
jgi:hypothetical protein